MKKSRIEIPVPPPSLNASFFVSIPMASLAMLSAEQSAAVLNGVAVCLKANQAAASLTQKGTQ